MRWFRRRRYSPVREAQDLVATVSLSTGRIELFDGATRCEVCGQWFWHPSHRDRCGPCRSGE